MALCILPMAPTFERLTRREIYALWLVHSHRPGTGLPFPAAQCSTSHRYSQPYFIVIFLIYCAIILLLNVCFKRRQMLLLRLCVNIDEQLCLRLYPSPYPWQGLTLTVTMFLTITLTEAILELPIQTLLSCSLFHTLCSPGTMYAKFDKVFNIILTNSRVYFTKWVRTAMTAHLNMRLRRISNAIGVNLADEILLYSSA